MTRARVRPRPSAELGTNTLPWSRRDLALLVVLMAVGTIGAGFCTNRVANRVTWADQVHWTVGALIFAGIGLLGVIAWLTTGSRNIRWAQAGAKRNYAALFQSVMGYPVHGDPTMRQISGAAEVYLTGPGMSRYHRPGCPVVTGKTAQPVGLAAAVAGGLEACAMCAAAA